MFVHCGDVDPNMSDVDPGDAEDPQRNQYQSPQKIRKNPLQVEPPAHESPVRNEKKRYPLQR